MALKSSVVKVDLQIADTDGHYYASHSLTLAQHPSETDERVMVRLLAFMLYASDELGFAKDMATDDEPALWQKDLSGNIELWLDVGLPDERELRKACGRAKEVVLLTYGPSASIWWFKTRDKLQGLHNLTVLNVPAAETQALAQFAERAMKLQCTIQDGVVLVTGEKGVVQVEPLALMRAGD